MASPIPKPAAIRQRRNRVVTSATLQAEPAVKVPLPARADPWHAMTVGWWDTIWASPMVAEWVAADVPDLIALAKLVDSFWFADADAPKIHAEIRLAQREFGLTPLARRSLQWEIVKVREAQARAQTPAQLKAHKDPRAILRAVG